MTPRELEAAHALWPLVQEAAVAEGLPAVTLLAILCRESACGICLDADLTGDRCLRCASRYPMRTGTILVSEMCDGYDWALPRDERGEVLTGPYVMPVDQLGWGRGLMQLDWATHQAWLLTHDWRDPATNLRRAAHILREDHEYLKARGCSDMRVAVAAYNCGPGRALAAYQGGHDPDEMTQGRDYSAWVTERARWLGAHGFT